MSYRKDRKKQIDVTEYGVKGDGVTDDTVAIQAILDSVSNTNTTTVFFPTGTYLVSETLVYKGNYGYSIRILGECVGAALSGTIIKWGGNINGTVFLLRGALGSSIEFIGIDGSQSCRTCLSVQYDHDRLVGSSFVTINNVYITGAIGDNSALISIGMLEDNVTKDIFQCDAILINKCILSGDFTGRTTGVLTGWGNTKNFGVIDCAITGCKDGVNFGGSGYMVIDRFAGGANTWDVVGATSTVEIRSMNSEQSTGLFKGSTGRNPGSVKISNTQWSGVAATGVYWNDCIIIYSSFIQLEGNHFWNVNGSGHTPNIGMDIQTGCMCELHSIGNYFAGASGVIPVVDSVGRDLSAHDISITTPFYAINPIKITSFGDYGDRFSQEGLIHFEDIDQSTKKIVTITSNTTLNQNLDIIKANATNDNIIVGLPDCTRIPRGKEYTIKKVDSSLNSVYISGVNGQLIDGLTVQPISTQYASLTLVTDKINWVII